MYTKTTIMWLYKCQAVFVTPCRHLSRSDSPYIRSSASPLEILAPKLHETKRTNEFVRKQESQTRDGDALDCVTWSLHCEHVTRSRAFTRITWLSVLTPKREAWNRSWVVFWSLRRVSTMRKHLLLLLMTKMLQQYVIKLTWMRLDENAQDINVSTS